MEIGFAKEAVSYWPQILGGITGIVGSFIGAITGGFVAGLQQNWAANRQKKEDRASAAAAFAADISARVQQLRALNVRESLRRYISLLRGGSDELGLSADGVRAMLGKNGTIADLTIYRANIANLGKLGPLAADVAQSYAMLDEMFATLTSIGEDHYRGYSGEAQLQVCLELEKELQAYVDLETSLLPRLAQLI